METLPAPTMDTPADDTAPPAKAVGAPLRAAGRPDVLMAQRIEVGIILQAMLGTPSAAEYMANNGVDPAVAQRVLHQPHLRRGRHDAFGILC